MKGLLRAAALGAAAALVASFLVGRQAPGTTLRGSVAGEGPVELVASVNDCGAGDGQALVLARAEVDAGPFELEVPTVGPGLGYVCAWQREGGVVVRAARLRLDGREAGLKLALSPVVWPRGLR